MMEHIPTHRHAHQTRARTDGQTRAKHTNPQHMHSAQGYLRTKQREHQRRRRPSCLLPTTKIERKTEWRATNTPGRLPPVRRPLVLKRTHRHTDTPTQRHTRTHRDTQKSHKDTKTHKTHRHSHKDTHAKTDAQTCHKHITTRRHTHLRNANDSLALDVEQSRPEDVLLHLVEAAVHAPWEVLHSGGLLSPPPNEQPRTHAHTTGETNSRTTVVTTRSMPEPSLKTRTSAKREYILLLSSLQHNSGGGGGGGRNQKESKK